MSHIEFDGLRNLRGYIDNMGNLPRSLSIDMLSAKGKVVRKAQAQEARSMLAGKYSKHAVAGAAALSAVKYDDAGRLYRYVRFKGTQHNVRLGEIAFLNEYGVSSRRIKARPFIRIANEKSQVKAFRAAVNVFDRWRNSKK